MRAIKHILYPVDFSPRCLDAAPFVKEMAQKTGAKVTMLSTVQPMVYGGGVEISMPVMIDPELLRASVKSRLERTLVDEFKGLTVERVSELGEAGQVVTEFAHKNGVDLIMLPTHGYGPFRRLLLGSVTAKVLHDARCPVWTEAHLEDPEIAKHLVCERVLCAVDRTSADADVMQWAADFAKSMGASLRLVHAVAGAEAWPERQFGLEFEETLRQQATEEIDALQKSAGVEAPLCVRTGDVARAVHEEAVAHEADVVVIGRGKINERLGRLRTNAHAIIRLAHCPVISV